MNARHLAWRAGAPARAVLVGMVHVYQATLSGWLGGQCRFAPTCSEYAVASIREHGALKGSAMAMWRIGRCNPYGKGGIDPVPAGRHHAPPTIPRSGEMYDVVVHDQEARA